MKNIAVTIDNVTIIYTIVNSWTKGMYEIVADNGMKQNMGRLFASIQDAEDAIHDIAAAKVRTLKEFGLKVEKVMIEVI